MTAPSPSSAAGKHHGAGILAHTSRIYDYLLGGTDNFTVDREVADHAFAADPGGIDVVVVGVLHDRAGGG